MQSSVSNICQCSFLEIHIPALGLKAALDVKFSQYGWCGGGGAVSNAGLNP